MNFTIETSTTQYELWNTTTDSPGVQVGITLVNVCELIFGCLGILGNLLCIVIFKRRSKHNHTNFLIIMQAGVDCVASVLMVCLTITSILNPPVPSYWFMGTIYCKFWTSYVLLWSSFAISTFNLTIISIERYIAVVHPLWYAKLFKRSLVVFIAMLAWFLAPTINIAYNVVVNYFDDGVCVESFNKTQKFLSIVLFFWEYFFPLCIMIFSFVFIARTLLKMNKVSDLMSANNSTMNETSQGSHVPTRMSSSPHKTEQSSTFQNSVLAQHGEGPQGHAICPIKTNVFTSNVLERPTGFQISAISTTPKPGCSSTNGTGNRSNKPVITPTFLTVKKPGNSVRPKGTRRAGASVRRLNITKVLLLVSLGFFVCWSPNQWYFLLLNLGAIEFSLVPYRVTIVMSTCNTCINPFIYALRMKTFRNEFMSMIRCKNRT